RRRSRSRNPCSSAFAVRSLLRNSTAAIVRSRSSSRPWRFVRATWSASMISRARLSWGFATSRTRPRTIGSDAGSSQRTFASTARSSSTAYARPWSHAFARMIERLSLYRRSDRVRPSPSRLRRIFAIDSRSGRSHHRLQRTLDDLAVVVEQPFVDDREQTVEDRAVRLPQLVEEREVGLGQIASRDSRESVLLQGGDRNRAEQFVGQREARQEALKIMRPLDGTCQHPDHHALRGPFRPDQEDVLAGQDSEDQAFDLLASFEETAFHLRLEGLEPCGLDHTRERLSARGAQIP